MERRNFFKTLAAISAGLAAKKLGVEEYPKKELYRLEAPKKAKIVEVKNPEIKIKGAYFEISKHKDFKTSIAIGDCVEVSYDFDYLGNTSWENPIYPKYGIGRKKTTMLVQFDVFYHKVLIDTFKEDDILYFILKHENFVAKGETVFAELSMVADSKNKPYVNTLFYLSGDVLWT